MFSCSRFFICIIVLIFYIVGGTGRADVEEKGTRRGSNSSAPDGNRQPFQNAQGESTLTPLICDQLRSSLQEAIQSRQLAAFDSDEPRTFEPETDTAEESMFDSGTESGDDQQCRTPAGSGPVGSGSGSEASNSELSHFMEGLQVSPVNPNVVQDVQRVLDRLKSSLDKALSDPRSTAAKMLPQEFGEGWNLDHNQGGELLALIDRLQNSLSLLQTSKEDSGRKQPQLDLSFASSMSTSPVTSPVTAGHLTFALNPQRQNSQEGRNGASSQPSWKQRLARRRGMVQRSHTLTGDGEEELQAIKSVLAQSAVRKQLSQQPSFDFQLAYMNTDPNPAGLADLRALHRVQNAKPRPFKQTGEDIRHSKSMDSVFLKLKQWHAQHSPPAHHQPGDFPRQQELFGPVQQEVTNAPTQQTVRPQPVLEPAPGLPQKNRMQVQPQPQRDQAEVDHRPPWARTTSVDLGITSRARQMFSSQDQSQQAAAPRRPAHHKAPQNWQQRASMGASYDSAFMYRPTSEQTREPVHPTAHPRPVDRLRGPPKYQPPPDPFANERSCEPPKEEAAVQKPPSLPQSRQSISIPPNMSRFLHSQLETSHGDGEDSQGHSRGRFDAKRRARRSHTVGFERPKSMADLMGTTAPLGDEQSQHSPTSPNKSKELEEHRGQPAPISHAGPTQAGWNNRFSHLKDTFSHPDATQAIHQDMPHHPQPNTSRVKQVSERWESNAEHQKYNPQPLKPARGPVKWPPSDEPRFTPGVQKSSSTTACFLGKSSGSLVPAPPSEAITRKVEQMMKQVTDTKPQRSALVPRHNAPTDDSPLTNHQTPGSRSSTDHPIPAGPKYQSPFGNKPYPPVVQVGGVRSQNEEGGMRRVSSQPVLQPLPYQAPHSTFIRFPQASTPSPVYEPVTVNAKSAQQRLVPQVCTQPLVASQATNHFEPVLPPAPYRPVPQERKDFHASSTPSPASEPVAVSVKPAQQSLPQASQPSPPTAQTTTYSPAPFVGLQHTRPVKVTSQTQDQQSSQQPPSEPAREFKASPQQVQAAARDDHSCVEMPPAVVKVAGEDKKFSGSVTQKQVESKNPLATRPAASVVSGKLQLSMRDLSPKRQPRSQSLDPHQSPRIPTAEAKQPTRERVLAPSNLPRPQQSLQVPVVEKERSRSKSPRSIVGRPFEASMDARTAEEKQKTMLAFFTSESSSTVSSKLQASKVPASPPSSGHQKSATGKKTLARQDTIEQEFDALADTVVAEVMEDELFGVDVSDAPQQLSRMSPKQTRNPMTKCRSLDSSSSKSLSNAPTGHEVSVPPPGIYDLSAAYAQYSEYSRLGFHCSGVGVCHPACQHMFSTKCVDFFSALIRITCIHEIVK